MQLIQRLTKMTICKMEKTDLENNLPSYLTQSPTTECPVKVQATIDRFCEIHESGRRLNEEIHRNRKINNPYFVTNALESYAIDQGSSNITSKQRQRWSDHFEMDSIEALRKHKRNQRQSNSMMDADKVVEAKDQSVGTEGMTQAQQAAISQCVMEAQERLQSTSNAKKSTRFH